MKKILLILMCTFALQLQAQEGVAINNDGSAPDGSALLDLKSTTKGILIPRMTESQRTLISNVATGLLVYQTDGSSGFYFYNGSAWESLSGGTNTLDEAYDEGGTGAGRYIDATDGAVVIGGMDGFQVIGSLGFGDHPGNTGYPNMFFYPKKAAFRAGFDDNGYYWSDYNIGLRSIAMGYNTLASEENATAIGNNTEASAENATAMGQFTIASGVNSTAMGFFTRSVGLTSTALGRGTQANGENSTAMGYESISQGPNSTATGYQTAAYGMGSISSGYRTKATGMYSTAMGIQTEAVTYGEMAIGRYNTISTGSLDRLFVVGNGVSSLLKSNALTIYESGVMNINDAYDMPTLDGTPGQVMMTNGAGVVSFSTLNTDNEWHTYGNLGTDSSTDFIGTLDLQDLVFRTNNIERIRISNTGNVGLGTANPIEVLDVIGNGRFSSLAGLNTGPRLIVADSSGVLQVLDNGSPGDVLIINGSDSLSFMPLSASGYQDLSLTDNTLSLTDDVTPVDLSGYLDNTDSQDLSLTGNTLSLTNDATTVDLSAYQSNTLDEAYDEGGAGAGRTIDAVDGTVAINGEDGLVVTGSLNSGLAIGNAGGIPEGPGTRMFFNPNKAAFRAGYVDGTQWDNVNVGLYSVAIGTNSMASATRSIAFGNFTSAIGNFSMALGYGTTASGLYSMAMGQSTNATGGNSTAFGSQTTASGFRSTAMGFGTAAWSYSETVIGSWNTSYTPASTGTWNSADRLFVVGNGTGSGAESDAMVILKNGNVGIGDATPDGKLEVRQTAAADIFNLYDNTINVLSVQDGGNVGIGTTSPAEKLQVAGNIYSSSGDLYTALNNGVLNCGGGVMTATINYIGDSYSVPSNVNGDEDLYIQDDLQVDGVAFKPNGGSWTGTSDKRLKKNIISFNDGLEELVKVKPVKFNYNEKSGFKDLDKQYIGVIAQDLIEVAPYMVEERNFWQEVIEDENGVERIVKEGEKFYTVDPSAFTYILINSVQEQQVIIESQNAEIDALKVQMTQMQKTLDVLTNK